MTKIASRGVGPALNPARAIELSETADFVYNFV